MLMYAVAVRDDFVCVCEEDNSKIPPMLYGTIRQTDRPGMLTRPSWPRPRRDRDETLDSSRPDARRFF